MDHTRRTTLQKSMGGSRSITDTITLIETAEVTAPELDGETIEKRFPAFELSIVNDGPNPVFVRKNDDDVNITDDISIKIGEVYNFPNCSSVAVVCNTGKVATIRFGAT